MPKQAIIQSNFPQPAKLEVTWGRDSSNLQIGIERGSGDDEFVYTVDGVVAVDWFTLDRDAVNHLIRTLRRARDAAYGADA